jgi:hypothetical protein
MGGRVEREVFKAKALPSDRTINVFVLLGQQKTKFFVMKDNL